MQLSTFQTQRLLVRDWSAFLTSTAARDAMAHRLAPILTENVLAPLPPTLQLTKGADAIPRWIADRADESHVSLIEELSSDTLIGLLTLAPTEPDTLHIGYLLGEAHWGKHYASELVQGLVNAAVQSGPITLIGGVSKDNPASARVLTKAGFTLDPATSTDDTDMFRYVVS